MSINDITFGLILGVLMCLGLNWIYFADWMGFLRTLAHLMYPKKVIKEFEDERNLRQTKDFKAHQRKWKMRFLIVPVIYAVSYLVFALVTHQIILAFFFGVIVALVSYEKLGHKEKKEREEIR